MCWFTVHTFLFSDFSDRSHRTAKLAFSTTTCMDTW